MAQEEIKKPSRIAQIAKWYGRFERPLSSASLVGGFVFDAVTLTRVDLFWENFWVLAHLAAVGACIIVINLKENRGMDEANPDRLHFWLVNTLQFFFGGLLSTFLVFYFRSGSLAASWPFFAILAAAFIANESLKRHYTRLSFQIGLFYLSLFLFAIYFLPVLLHRIGPDVFLLSGIFSIAFLCFFLFLLVFLAKEKFRRGALPLFLSISGIFIGVNFLYFFRLIPPIPLSIENAGIAHALSVSASGIYTAEQEDVDSSAFFRMYEHIHWVPGTPLYAYSAIFSPVSFATAIVHEWQWYDEDAQAWKTTDRINLAAVGGRAGGYRTYSMKTGLAPGKWRVSVETSNGQVIGRLRFLVITVKFAVPRKTTIIN